MARVLVIDDCPDHLDWTRCALQAEGLVVIEARDALAGLQYAVESTPDLVLVAAALGGLDGLDVADRIARDPESRGLPVIVMAEQPDARLARAARALGVAAIIPRSYRRSDLVGPVRERLFDAGITWMATDRRPAARSARGLV